MTDEFKCTEHWSRVRQLNAKIDPSTAPNKVTMPSADMRLLRARLILEEAMETIDALGISLYRGRGDEIATYPKIEFDSITLRADHEPNMVEIADGCADVSVVTIGTLVCCGIPDRDLLRLVDTNNLAKFGPGGYRREDGKWIKPPDHCSPDIAALLKELGWES